MLSILGICFVLHMNAFLLCKLYDLYLSNKSKVTSLFIVSL